MTSQSICGVSVSDAQTDSARARILFALASSSHSLLLVFSLALGCILSELYTGYPLFPGENETEQLACMMEVLGPPPKRMIQESTRKKAFFDAQGKPLIVPNSRGKLRTPGSKDLAQATKCNDATFLSFLRRALRWDPKLRLTPEKALEHPWITEQMAPPAPSPQLQSGFGPSPSPIVSQIGAHSSRGDRVQAKLNAANAANAAAAADGSARASASINVVPTLQVPLAGDYSMNESQKAAAASGSSARRPSISQANMSISMSISGGGSMSTASRALFPPISGKQQQAGGAIGSVPSTSRQLLQHDQPMDTQ